MYFVERSVYMNARKEYVETPIDCTTSGESFERPDESEREGGGGQPVAVCPFGWSSVLEPVP